MKLATKKWWMSRTILSNLLTILITVLALAGVTPNQELMRQLMALVLLLNPIINTLLRFDTDERITL